MYYSQRRINNYVYYILWVIWGVWFFNFSNLICIRINIYFIFVSIFTGAILFVNITSLYFCINTLSNLNKLIFNLHINIANHPAPIFKRVWKAAPICQLHWIHSIAQNLLELKPFLIHLQLIFPHIILQSIV